MSSYEYEPGQYRDERSRRRKVADKFVAFIDRNAVLFGNMYTGIGPRPYSVAPPAPDVLNQSISDYEVTEFARALQNPEQVKHSVQHELGIK